MTYSAEITTVDVVAPEITTVNVIPSQVVTVLVPAGSPGADGSDGDITRISRTAATALSGHRAVATNASGQFIYADKDTPQHAQCTIGILTGAASEGDTATAIALGPLTEPTWNWIPQQAIFLGSNGQLTQTAPTTGFVLMLGKAVTSTQVFIHVQLAFVRS